MRIIEGNEEDADLNVSLIETHQGPAFAAKCLLINTLFHAASESGQDADLINKLDDLAQQVINLNNAYALGTPNRNIRRIIARAIDRINAYEVKNN